MSLATAEDCTLVLERLSKSYGGTKVLCDVSARFNRHEVHALVGGNGSGKSTLIKLLAGVTPPDPGGQITANGQTHPVTRWTPHDARAAHLRFVHQDLGLFEDLSVADNLSIGYGYPRSRWGRIRWRRVHEHSRALLARHGVDPDDRRLLGELSLADQSMIAIARALQDIDVDAGACVVLDESTSALPARERERLLGMIRSLANHGHAVLFVSHHLDEVLNTSDRVTVLRDGRRVHSGPTKDLDRSALIDLMLGSSTAASMPVPQHAERSRGAPLLRAREVASGHATSITMTVHRREIVGIVGLPDSGADDIARVLFGLQPMTGGELLLDEARYAPRSPRQAMRAGVALLPGDRLRDGVFPALAVLNNVTAASTRVAGRWRLRRRHERARAQTILDQYRVRPPDVQRPIETLSGGNQQKVLLARWGCRAPRLLLLEEPTRGVDVGARTDIWQLLRRAVTADDLTILVTSSDFDELADNCDRVIVIAGGRVQSELAGDTLTPSQITRAIYEVGPSAGNGP